MAIDFSRSPELEEIRARVRTFVEDVIKPTEQKIHDEELAKNDRKAYFGALVGMRDTRMGGDRCGACGVDGRVRASA